MRPRTKRYAWLIALVVAIGLGTTWLTATQGPGHGQSFQNVPLPFSQDLYATSADLLVDLDTGVPGILGGLAFAPDGGVWAAECLFDGTRLHRFASAPSTVHSSPWVHAETGVVDLRLAGPASHPAVGGCGLVNHPDGSLYSSSTAGVWQLDASDGHYLAGPFGPGANALGIAVDPVSHHLVYVGDDCHPNLVTATDKCTIWDVDAVAPHAAVQVAQFARQPRAFLDGIYFDPSGAYLFAAYRDEEVDPNSGFMTADNALQIIQRSTGATVRRVHMESEPDGVAFHAGDGFVVTVNESLDCTNSAHELVASDPNTHACTPGTTPIGGTITKFDFGGNYAAMPLLTTFATDGFRGDLTQVGADGCLYATQAPIEGGIGVRGDTTAGSAIVANIDVTALSAGTPVIGPGIPPATQILTVDPILWQITLTQNATDTASDVGLRFGAGTRYNDGVQAFDNSLVQICGGGGFVPPPGVTAAPLATASIAGIVFEDRNTNGVRDANEPGIGGVLVTLSGTSAGTTTTASDGSYSFSGLDGGSYVVSSPATAAGLALGTTSPLSKTLSEGQNITDVDFGYVAGSLAGVVFEDRNKNGIRDGGEPGIGNITVTLSGQAGKTTTTAADGGYAFTGLVAGAYTISSPATAIGLALGTGNPLHATLVEGGIKTGLDFGYISGSIAGVVYKDLNKNNARDAGEPGIDNVTVTLSTGATTTTSGGGSYSFLFLAGGSYTVSVPSTAVGLALLSASPASVSLAPGEDKPDVNFGYINGSVAGVAYWDLNKNGARDAGEPPVAGATITLNPGGSTRMTLSDGSYKFIGLVGDAYTVGAPAVVNGLALETASLLSAPLAAGGNLTNLDFPYVSGSISGYAYVDANGNGVKDSGEAGIGGVSISLGGPLVVTTANDGSYLFTLLTAATYTDTAPPSAGSLSLVTTSPLMVTLPAGGSQPNVNFGYKAVAAYVTYTQGGWGAPPNGNNPGMILKNNFATVYPTGYVQIGGSPYYLKFTSALAIQNFLPAGGTPGVLNKSATNPTSSSANVFAGQVLALQLSVDFSNKGVITTGLSARKIAPGHPMAGSTVAQVLAVANQVIAGNTSALPTGMSVSSLNNLLSDMNQNYDGGTTNNGLLIQ